MSDHPHQQDVSDPLDDFIAQLLADIPEFQPIPITFPPSPPAFVSATGPATDHGQDVHLACQWVVAHSPTLVCGALLPPDREQACTHFRQAHDIRGNEKVVVSCHWHDCPVPPMQRGSLVRHVLSVHLGLLRWRCEACGKVFSRKGTGHACVNEDGV